MAGLENSEQLQAFLDMLVETGVAEFEGFGIHVRFTDNLFVKENQTEMVKEERTEPRNMWESPELWPGGVPPEFPGAKRK